MKPDSTYNMGMKPVIYSVKDAEKQGFGWQRDGFNIAYYQNQRKRKALVNDTKGNNSGISTTSTTISGASNNN